MTDNDDAPICPPHYYASEFSANVQLSDAKLSFGRTLAAFSPDGEVLEGRLKKEWFATVSVSPPTLKAMANVLNAVVAHYEQKHGAITAVPGFKAGDERE